MKENRRRMKIGEKESEGKKSLQKRKDPAGTKVSCLSGRQDNARPKGTTNEVGKEEENDELNILVKDGRKRIVTEDRALGTFEMIAVTIEEYNMKKSLD